MTPVLTNYSIILAPRRALLISAEAQPGQTIVWMWNNPDTGVDEEVAKEVNNSSNRARLSITEGEQSQVARVVECFIDDTPTTATAAKHVSPGHAKKL